MRKVTILSLFLTLAAPYCYQSGTSAFAQSDIEITDSTSTDWGGGPGGGGINPSEPDNPVTSISISHQAITLEGGELFRLTANVDSRAKDKLILWSSADENIASVQQNGLVMALKKGTTTITATAHGDNSIKATCKVTVTSDYVPPTSGWIIPWGQDQPWTMRYQFFEGNNYPEPPADTAGNNWTQPGYDDSSWPSLTGPIGDKMNFNHLWEGDNNGYLLRSQFYLDAVSTDVVYSFYAIHDDDLTVYINGQQAAYFDDWSHDQIRSIAIPAHFFVKGFNQLALVIRDLAGNQYLDYALYQKAKYAKDVSLPDVPFEFFYSAEDYAADIQSIPNQRKANLKDASLQLTENIPTFIDGNLLRVEERCEGYIDQWEKGSTLSGEHFYRSGNDNMTIVCKLAPRVYGLQQACDFISNRGGGFNYMLRIGGSEGFYLHTAYGYSDERSLVLKDENPCILSVRVDGTDNYILLENLSSGEKLRIPDVNWGGSNNVFKIFYNDGGEFYLGDFYWVYYSFQLLTDAQIRQVARAAGDDIPETPTSISHVNNPSAEPQVFSVTGIPMRKDQLKRGVYIINGKKRYIL